MQKHIARLLLLMVVCLSIPLVPARADAGQVTVFFTTDTHGAIFDSTLDTATEQIGYSRFLSYINQHAAETERLVLDGGGGFYGSAFASLSSGTSIAKLMNTIGYDAAAIGSQDFTYGADTLLGLEKDANIDLLSANIKKDGQIRYKPWVIKEVNGCTIGLFGLTSPAIQAQSPAHYTEGLDFGSAIDLISAAKSAVSELHAAGAQCIIGLTSLGIDPQSEIKVTDIAANIDGIDLIIDSGNAVPFDNGYIEVNGTMITTAGQNFEHFGAVHIDLTSGQKQLQLQILDTASLAPLAQDPVLSSQINTIQQQQQDALQQQIALSPIDLDGSLASVQSSDTALTNLVAQAYKTVDTEIDVSFFCAADIGGSIPAGTITRQILYDILPADMCLVSMEMTGQELAALLEQGLAYGTESFLHFFGMQVYAKNSAVIGNAESDTPRYIADEIQVDAAPLEPSRTYLVCMPENMANGKAGYSWLADKPIKKKYLTCADAVINYAATLSEDAIRGLEDEAALQVEDAKKILSNQNTILLSALALLAITFVIYWILRKKRGR